MSFSIFQRRNLTPKRRNGRRDTNLLGTPAERVERKTRLLVVYSAGSSIRQFMEFAKDTKVECNRCIVRQLRTAALGEESWRPPSGFRLHRQARLYRHTPYNRVSASRSLFTSKVFAFQVCFIPSLSTPPITRGQEGGGARDNTPQKENPKNWGVKLLV